MNHFVFKDPIWFLALAALPIIWWMRGRRRVPVLLVPFAAAWHRPSLATPSRWPVGLAFTGLVLLVVAHVILGERINRLQAIKPVIQAFIEKRPADRIGVVLFSGRAYTMAPLTFDHDWLAKQLERVRIGMIEDGTAIGDGLGVSLTRLEQAKRESGGKRQGAFIVLLTDGANNRGALTPAQATDLAKSRGIPVYTIGAGQDGLVPFPVFDDKGRKIGYRRVAADLDEGALREIATATGGKFFRAFDTDTAEAAFKAIDKAQKIEFQAKSYLLTTELFTWAAAPGISVLLLAGIFARPAWRKGTFA